MAFNNGIRSASKFLSQQPLLSKSVNRGFHSTGVKQMGGHRPRQADLSSCKAHVQPRQEKLKMSLLVSSAVGVGISVPIFAVVFQQKKTASA